MNNLSVATIRSPSGINEECALFEIDDTYTPFVLHNITQTGQQYTLSLYVCSESPGSITTSGITMETNLEWKQYIAIFTAENSDVPIYFGSTGKYYVYYSQLEIGNKATDWTPAPEDTESKITTLSTQYTQLADRFNWLVTSDSSQSSLTLTDSMLAAMVKQFIVTSPDGSATIISGGKITTDNIVGTNGWINLALGTFNYGNGKLTWDGTTFKVANWNIIENALYIGNSTIGTAGNGNVYLGTAGVSFSDKLVYKTSDGSLAIKGDIVATTLTATENGQIGPWYINSNSIYKGSSVFGTAGSGNMYFGNNGLSISDTFKVDPRGTLRAKEAVLYDRLVMYNSVNAFETAVIKLTESSNYINSIAIGEYYELIDSISGNTLYSGTNIDNLDIWVNNMNLICGDFNINANARISKTLYFYDTSNTSQMAAIARSGTKLVLNGDSGENQIGNGVLAYGPLTVTGTATVGKLISNNGGVFYNAGVELYFSTPFIDFHFGNSTADYTSRIIESSSGVLYVNSVKCSGGAIDVTNMYLNGQTSYNRLSSDTKFTYGWNCTSSGHLIPVKNASTVNPNNLNIGNTSTYIANLYYGGSLSKQSDRRIKNPIGKLTEDEALVILRGSKIEKFTYKNDDLQRINYGIYAQDLRDLLISSGIGHISMLGIDIVDSDGEQTKDLMIPEESVRYTVDYTQYAPLLVCGWQYHEDDIKDLKSRVKVLEEENKMLKQKLNIA